MGEQPETMLAVKAARGWANNLKEELTNNKNNSKQPHKPVGFFFIGNGNSSQRYWYCIITDSWKKYFPLVAVFQLRE